ncbi:hypothetical protein D9M71_689320 [compost metagenome]
MGAYEEILHDQDGNHQQQHGVEQLDTTDDMATETQARNHHPGSTTGKLDPATRDAGKHQAETQSGHRQVMAAKAKQRNADQQCHRRADQ